MAEMMNGNVLKDTLMDSTGSHCSVPQYFFLSLENNLLLITSWISSPAPMTSQGLSGLSLSRSVFVCVCVCVRMQSSE